MVKPAISASHPVLLGSGSPRRRAILDELGLPFVAAAPDVDESGMPGDTTETYLARVVSDKMSEVLRSRGQDGGPFSVAVVADTVVVIDEQILGKPGGVGDAFQLLRRLAGRTHRVHTRYALRAHGDAGVERTVVSEVSIRAASDAELQSYADSHEGLDKAGAYAVQGLGSFLVEQVRGSYTNVVGLPACELIQDLKQLGVLPRFPL